MELPGTAGLVAVGLLLAANGFFVAAEFAIVAVRRARLEQLAEAGRGDAKTALQVVAHLDTYIAACQVGITLASLVLGWIGEPALAHLIEPPLEALIGAFAPAFAHAISVAISLALITALHIIVGEQAPKGLALQKPEAVVLWTARPLRVFELAFRWPTALLQRLTGLLLRLMGLEPVTGHESVHSVEELRMLVTGSQQAGVVEASEARIATRAFSFADHTAGALMTPRTEVDAIPLDLPLDQLITRLDATPRSRLPVYEESLDHVTGFLYVPDFYRALRRAPLSPVAAPVTAPVAPDGTQPAQFDLRSLLRAPMIVPDSKPADDLLEEMRSAGRYFAVVIDEYGGTAGILTLEDLVEALIGPMKSEAPLTGAAESPEAIVRAEDGSLFVDGLTRLEELEEVGHLRFEESDHEEVETVGGLFMARLGRIPVEGDEVVIDGRTLRVERLDGLRVALVRLLPGPEPDAEASAPAGSGGHH